MTDVLYVLVSYLPWSMLICLHLLHARMIPNTSCNVLGDCVVMVSVILSNVICRYAVRNLLSHSLEYRNSTVS